MTDQPIQNVQSPVEIVEHNIYRERKMSLGKENQTAEVDCRIPMLWIAYGRLRFIFKSDILLYLKARVCPPCF